MLLFDVKESDANRAHDAANEEDDELLRAVKLRLSEDDHTGHDPSEHDSRLIDWLNFDLVVVFHRVCNHMHL